MVVAGAVESLEKETTPLGLRTLLLEPGRFRTPLLSESQLRPTRTKILDYKQASDAHNDALAAGSMQQPGDPKKFVQIAIDLVKEEGVAANRPVPFRMPLGIDSLMEIEAKIAETTRTLQDWRPIIVSTDHEMASP